MKVLNNPNDDSMICVLPNGVTVEVMQVNMIGNKSNAEQSTDTAIDIVKKLPPAMLDAKQRCSF